MATQLITHLWEMREKHSEFELLDAQWKFDQELIQKALSNIPNVFAHFSRHDASHSRHILTNIERLMGAENIKLLTATDTWLILESAYWHDIGMVVTHEQIKKDMASEEFLVYIESVAAQAGHELQGFARQFRSLDTKTCFAFAETPQDAINLYRQLLAGWYRKKHPARAEVIVNDPWEEAGIASPRNELVPRRLFRLLGTICRMHGSSFEAVLSQLPFAESGMANEKCHPRFVACLLRLGDLFDLDDNRFCPAMLRVAGDVPLSSVAHIKKHASIRHMRLDTEIIELIAQCDGYESYEATDEWFSWIRDEVRDQMSNWKDIVPKREFGLLPTLGKLEVNIGQGNEVLNTGERPRFGVDPEKVMELLQGTGLYDSPWQCMRELLQNSVDATLLKVWLMLEGTGTPSDVSSPYSNDVRQMLDRFPINVSLVKDSVPALNGKVRWRVRIEDWGLGISKQDIQFMQKIGGSSKNTTRKSIERRMPKWLKPSGAFGIGLQSAFLIADEISFHSKSLLTGDSLNIRMTSPIKSERGMIYIHRYDAHPARDSGTVLEFIVSMDAIPSQISLSGFGASMARDVIAKFDPVCQEDVPYGSAKIADEILKFREYCPIRIDLNFNGEQFPDKKYSQSVENPYYDDSTGVSIMEYAFNYGGSLQTRIAFRGQLLEDPKPFLPFLGVVANILSSSAGEMLTINRNSIKEAAKDLVNTNIIETVLSWLGSRLGFPEIMEERIAASAFLLVMGKEDIRPDLNGVWRKLNFSKEKNFTIETLCSMDRFTIALVDYGPFGQGVSVPSDVDLVLNSDPFRDGGISLLVHNWKKLMDKNITIDFKGENQNSIILDFNSGEYLPFTDNALRHILVGIMRNGMGLTGRYHAPVWGNYLKLAAKTDDLGWCRSIFHYQNNGPQFVLPFFFPPKTLGDPRVAAVTVESLDALCSWTQKHTLANANEFEIRKSYNDFIEWVDADLMKDVDIWQEARKMGSVKH